MKNQTFLKLTLLVLCFVFSCQQGDFAEELQQLDDMDTNGVNDGTVITRSNFDNFNGLDVLYKKTVTDQSKYGKVETTGKSGYDFEIDRSRVTEIRIDGNTYYTMAFLGPENGDFSFYNVVVCEYKDKDPEAFLMGYFPDDNYINGLQTGETTRFTGDTTIQTLDYEKALNSNSCYTTVVPMCSNIDGGHRRGEACDPDYYYTASFTTCVIGSLDSPGGGPGPGGGHSGDTGFDGASGNGGGTSISSDLPYDFATDPISHLDTSSYNLLKVTLGITDTDQLHYLWINPLIADELFNFIKDNSYSSPAKELAKTFIEVMVDEKESFPAFQQEYRNRMSNSEKTIFNSLNQFKQKAYLVNGQKATWEAEKFYPESLRNGHGDAFRHAYFNASNAILLGNSLAEDLATAHEDKPFTYPYDFKEKQMDLFNNEVGRTKKNWFFDGYNSLTESIQDALSDGELRYLTNLQGGLSYGLATGQSQLIPTN